MRPQFLMAAAAIAVSSAAYAVTASNSAAEFEVDFVTHIDVGMAEQDVMIERTGEQGVVYRVTANDGDLTLPLFAAATPLAHNPFDSGDIGPYPKGQALNVSLGEWLSAKGSARYVEENGKGRLTAEFEGLIPGGVYTMWHFFMSASPTDPFIGTFDLPVGNPDGTQSVFVADAKGRATFDQTFEPGLQLTGKQLTSGLAIAWHSDGETYGVLPGDFGKTSHLQMFTALPAEE